MNIKLQPQAVEIKSGGYGKPHAGPQWLYLLSGANLNGQTRSNGHGNGYLARRSKANAAEIIGRADYPLYRS
jgi:hypothetical protein